MKNFQNIYLKILNQGVNIDNIFSQFKYEKIQNFINNSSIIQFLKNQYHSIAYGVKELSINKNDSRFGNIYINKNKNKIIVPIYYLDIIFNNQMNTISTAIILVNSDLECNNCYYSLNFNQNLISELWIYQYICDNEKLNIPDITLSIENIK